MIVYGELKLKKKKRINYLENRKGVNMDIIVKDIIVEDIIVI